MTSKLPPVIESGVFTASVQRTIDAPIERVWDVLTDLPKYHEWNPFVRAMTIVDASKKEDADQTLIAGKFLLMKCHIPPSMSDKKVAQKPYEIVDVVDKEKRLLAWTNIDYPRWAMRAQRWQALSESEDGKTLYETRETFSGVFAYLLKWFLGKSLLQAFEAFADGLKKRCEQT